MGLWLPPLAGRVRGGPFVNLVAGAPLPAALGIAAGNTLEAVAGVWVLGRAGFQTQLDRVDAHPEAIGRRALDSGRPIESMTGTQRHSA